MELHCATAGGEKVVNSDKLKGLMREKRITQADIAEKLGIKPCTVNQKLNNIRGMDLEEAEKICDILNIDVGDFGTYFFSRPVA